MESAFDDFVDLLKEDLYKNQFETLYGDPDYDYTNDKLHTAYKHLFNGRGPNGEKDLGFNFEYCQEFIDKKIVAYERIPINTYQVTTYFFWIEQTSTYVESYFIFYGLDEDTESGMSILRPKYIALGNASTNSFSTWYEVIDNNSFPSKKELRTSKSCSFSIKQIDKIFPVKNGYIWNCLYEFQRNYILSDMEYNDSDVYQYSEFKFNSQDVFFSLPNTLKFKAGGSSNTYYDLFKRGQQLVFYDYINSDAKMYEINSSSDGSSYVPIMYHEMPSTKKQWIPINQQQRADNANTSCAFYVTSEDYEEMKKTLGDNFENNEDFIISNIYVHQASRAITKLIQKVENVNLKNSQKISNRRYTDFMYALCINAYKTITSINIIDVTSTNYVDLAQCTRLHSQFYLGLYYAMPNFLFDDSGLGLKFDYLLDFSKNPSKWKAYTKTITDTNGYNKIQNDFTGKVSDYYENGGKYITYKESWAWLNEDFAIHHRFNDKAQDFANINNPFKNQNIFSNISSKVLEKFNITYAKEKTSGGSSTDDISFDFVGDIYLPIGSIKETQYLYFSNDGKVYLNDNYTLFKPDTPKSKDNEVHTENETITVNGLSYSRCDNYQQATYLCVSAPYTITCLNYLVNQEAINKTSLFYEYHYYSLPNDNSLLEDTLQKVSSSGYLVSSTILDSETYPINYQELITNYYDIAQEMFMNNKTLDEVLAYVKNQILQGLMTKYEDSTIVENEKEHKYDVYYGKTESITNIYSYMQYVSKYNLIQRIDSSSGDIKNILYYRVDNKINDKNLLTEQDLVLHINKECLIRLSYEISWIGALEDGTQVSIYNESDKEFIEQKVKFECPDSVVVHYPNLNKSIVYVILNDVTNNSAPLISNQYFNFETRNNKKINYYSYALKEGYEINIPLVNQSKYKLEVFNIFGDLLKTTSINSNAYKVKNPYGNSLVNSLDAPFSLRNEYITKALRQLIYSNGDIKYGAENNGLVYTLPEKYCLQIEKTLGTVSHLAVMFKDDSNNNKYLNGNMVIENFYGNNHNLKVSIKNGIASIPIDDLRAYGWNFDGKFTAYQTTGSYEITDEIVQNFFSHEILSKYTISFNCNNLVTLENVNVFVDMAYSSNYSYLDLNQDGKCDSLIKWTLPNGTEVNATSKYYDILGNEIIAETKFVPNSYLGLYNVPKYTSKIDDNIKYKAQNSKNKVSLYYNSNMNSTNTFKVIKISEDTVNGDKINAKLYYVSNNGTSVIVK
jgi:hypothetical protein